MGECNNEPIVFTDLMGREFTVFDQNHSHSDILRYMIADVGFDEVQAIYNQLKGAAINDGSYNEYR
jgi:hypothetical protein